MVNNGHAMVRRATVSPDLSKQLLDVFRPDNYPPPKRISYETAESLSEVIRRFVVEAHGRATIEAECDAEGEEDYETTATNKDERNKNSNSNDDESHDDDKNTEDQTNKKPVPIHAKHITKIAAELLMDFS